MLFAVKRQLKWSLLAIVAIAIVYGLATAWLQMPRRVVFSEAILWMAAAGLGVIAVSDATAHGAAWLLAGERYLHRYRALANYFQEQGWPDIVGGGLLAAAEELFFRALILEFVWRRLEWGLAAALGISALTFMVLHIIPDRRLAPFAVWALWEGLLLGLVYVLSGSLLVSMLVHGLHDVTGFSLFALQRRTGWLMYGGGEVVQTQSAGRRE